MNYLRLTPQQVIEIQSQLSAFDDEEVAYNGTVRVRNATTEADDFNLIKNYEVWIDWLEIQVLDKFFTLIDRSTELKGAIIQLTDKQYDEIREKLFK